MGTFDVTRSTSLIQSTSVYVQTRKRSQPTGGMATLALIALLITTLIVTCSTNSHDLITVFPLQIRSERDLPNCATANTVCSILQKRYWLPSVLNRYCRCPEGLDCPSDWTSTDNVLPASTSLVPVKRGPAYSLSLTNRAQMKFCSSIKTIETCAFNQSAINVRINGSSQDLTDPSQFPSTRVLCKCPSNNTWQQTPRTEVSRESSLTASYTCKALRRCRYRATCGAITTDTFSVYPYCLCRRGSVCTIENRTLTHVEELHYSGLAYLGVCKP